MMKLVTSSSAVRHKRMVSIALASTDHAPENGQFEDESVGEPGTAHADTQELRESGMSKFIQLYPK